MKYKREKIDNIFLYDTRVDNIFINEYMTFAPGEYVKVYFLGLMYAENGQDVENHIIAQQLNMPEEDIEKAWKYWADKGAVRICEDAETREKTIKFVNIRERMFGFGLEPEEEFVVEEGIQKVFRAFEEKWQVVLSGKELEEVGQWPEFYDVTPELILKGLCYCAEIKKTSVRYLEKVIQNWSENGLKTGEDAQKFLDENDQKYYRYKRVLKALGFNRSATEAEKALIDSWFEDMKFNMERVLEACGTTCGIGNPNLKYVDTVLTNWYKTAEEKGVDINKKSVVTQAVLNNYYSYLRDEAERKAKERKEEIYSLLPRVKEIDSEISSLGSRVTSAIISGNAQDQGKYNKKMDQLMAERAILLTESNFEMDYTDIKYSCEICKDTGLTDEGEKCQCIKQRIEEAEVWERSLK